MIETGENGWVAWEADWIEMKNGWIHLFGGPNSYVNLRGDGKMRACLEVMDERADESSIQALTAEQCEELATALTETAQKLRNRGGDATG